jgi:hypothetical protein
MKIKAGHIAFAIILLITGFVIFAFQRTKPVITNNEPVVTAALASTDTPEAGAPSIWVESNKIDLGLVPNHEKHYDTMTVENRGEQNLKIIKINTTCPCTQGIIDPDDSVIPPGGSAEIQIQLDPFRMAGFTSTKTLTIVSNDVKNPQLKVDVSAHVNPEYELLPQGVANFQTVQQGETPKIKYILRQLNEEALEILGIREDPPKKNQKPKPDSGIFLYSYVRLPEDSWKEPGKAEYEITVQVAANAPIGEHNKLFFIRLNLRRAWITRSGAAVTIV